MYCSVVIDLFITLKNIIIHRNALTDSFIRFAVANLQPVTVSKKEKAMYPLTSLTYRNFVRQSNEKKPGNVQLR